MKSKSIIKLSAIILICAVLITACGEGISARTAIGIWSGDVFTNEWANFKFTLPEGFTKLSDSEMKEVLGAGEDAIINSGAATEREIDFSRTNYVYEFFVVADDGISQVYLSYEGVVSKDADTPEKYFAVASELLVTTYAPLGINVEILPASRKTIAGEEFYQGSIIISADGGMGYQDFFIRKKDDVFIIIAATYYDETMDLIQDALNSFVKAS